MAQKADGAVKKGAKKLLKRFGFAFILQGIPVIGILGDLSMPCTRLVLREIGLDIGPESILMMPIAGMLDVIKIIVSVVELCFADADLSLISTIIGWVSWIFFGIWIYLRGSGGTTKAIEPKKPKITAKPLAVKK